MYVCQSPVRKRSFFNRWKHMDTQSINVQRIRDCGGINSKWDIYIIPYTKVQESYWRRGQKIVRARG